MVNPLTTALLLASQMHRHTLLPSIRHIERPRSLRTVIPLVMVICVGLEALSKVALAGQLTPVAPFGRFMMNRLRENM